MKKTVFILLIILFSINTALATDLIFNKYDGHQWNKWGSSERLYFLLGFVSGTTYVVDEGLHTSSKELFNDDKHPDTSGRIALEVDLFKCMVYEQSNPEYKCDTKYHINKVALLLEAKDYARDTELFIRFAAFPNKYTMGQIQDGLNSLYDDFKNRNIKIADAVYVVKKQIAGTSAADIERILLYLRSNKVNRKYLEKDEKGNSHTLRFP